MIQIYNSLSKTKEKFLPGTTPSSDGVRVRMFVCGPTVYDYMHIGNARTFVIFDVVAKWLRYRGYDLTYIQNITDIDDKIIARAKEHGKDPLAYAREFEEKFLEDARALGVTSPDYKRATDHISEVIGQVKRLIEKGHVYEIRNDGFYFDLSTFSDYGKLSGRTDIQDGDAVSRIDENENKRNKGDFCVWKGSLENGRPGWHIEDTAITEKYFGPQYDLHGGGIDLMFPHHEAEIAQMESISGLKPFVKYWMHGGFLTVPTYSISQPRTKGFRTKMAKSAGNFMTVREALKQYSAETLRFYFLSAHYRSPLDFSDEALGHSEAATARLAEFRARLAQAQDALPEEKNDFGVSLIKKAREDIKTQLDDDFNVPKAYAKLFDFVTVTNTALDGGAFDRTSAHEALQMLDDLNKTLGIIPAHSSIPAEVGDLAAKREQCRLNRDFKAADDYRVQIESLGYSINDTPYGPLAKPK